MRLRILLSIAAAIVTVTSAQTASAAAPFYASQFKLHDFDAQIIDSLGNPDAAILYMREMGSVTEDQARIRRQYEPIGCHPFYLMVNGKAEELGYNCQTFFCIGYAKGPRVCQDTRKKAYGGAVEISRRLGLVTIQDLKVPFTQYPEADRTEAMKARLATMQALKCEPFFLQQFDVIVGEGVACEEIGSYPQYSGKFECLQDFRKNEKEMTCSIQIRDNEMEIRAKILKVPVGGSSSSRSSAASSVSSGVASSASSSSSSLRQVSFPDVEQGKYGYTAIMALASHSIIKGYPDGTFRPKNVINRAELVQLLVLGLYQDRMENSTRCFPDADGQWYARSVCTAKSHGWVSGYADGKFHPERTMRRSEAIKVIVASLGQNVDSRAALPQGVVENAWYTPFVRKAVELGIILEPSFDAEGEVTRADAAVWMYRAAKLLKKI